MRPGAAERSAPASHPCTGTSASRLGRALIDRHLYLPRDSRCANGPRRTAAGIPEQAVFATKPHLARDMIAAALDADTPARWVAGDEVYGQEPALRAELEASNTGYVLAVWPPGAASKADPRCRSLG
ncbi:transposase [Streptomyces sp. NPDC006430]|uniref:transposase n=1 Tax=Streptomyces sp. NPDC006430 TaxID=3154299 RepID=UPI0033AFF9F1